MKSLAETDKIRACEDSEGVIFDYRYDYPKDILHIYNKKDNSLQLKSSVCYFGYEFNEDASPKQRSEFIYYLQGAGGSGMQGYQLQQFIEEPLNELDKKISMYSIDCFVFPEGPGRSRLEQKMVEVIDGYSSRSAHKIGYERIKSAPADIGFEKEKGKKILIAGSRNTSGSTFNEILRVLKAIDNSCEIYIYTLLRNYNI